MREAYPALPCSNDASHSLDSAIQTVAEIPRPYKP
jgi:hypothetical protein